MLRKLLAVAMVATLMLGGAAWAGTTIDVSTDTSPVAVVDTTTSEYYVDATLPTQTATPFVITSMTVNTNGAWIGWSDAGATISLNAITTRIGTLTFSGAPAASAYLNISHMANVTVGNRVLVDNGTQALPTGIFLQADQTTGARGTLNFEKGADINSYAGLRTNGGIITSGSAIGEEITLGVDFAFQIDTTGNAVLAPVDASGAHFIVDGAAIGGVGAIDWIADAGPEVADLTVGSLGVLEGRVTFGLENTSFTSKDTVYAGGKYNDPDPANATGWADARIRLSNEGGAITWENGIDIGPGAQVYTVDDTAVGNPVTVTVGTANTPGSGDVIVYGSDEFFDISGLAVLDGIEAPLNFVDASGGSAIRLEGTLVALVGTIDTGTTATNRMDMIVDLSAEENGFVNGALAAVNTPGNALEGLSLGFIGEKFRGLGVISDIVGGSPTDVSVKNYKQIQGTLFGSGGLGNRPGGFGFGPITLGPSILNIYGTTTVNGGIMAIDANVNGDMSFNGTSFNTNDTAVLAGIGQVITNDTQRMSGTNTFNYLELEIGANASMNLSLAGLDLVDMDTYIDPEGDLVFGSMILPGQMRPTDMELNVTATATREIDFIVPDSGSVKFNEAFLKTDFSNPAIYATLPTLIDTTGDVFLDVPELSFTGLFGTFETAIDTNNDYILSRYVRGTVDFDGTAQDFAEANSQLNDMYGNKTNTGLNAMIYSSVVDVVNDPAAIYDRLFLVGNATTDDVNSFTMNMRNLQHFAAGRGEANSVFNLYNGNAMNGVNMVSQAVARSHIRTAMNRSDEIRETWNMVKNTVSGGDGLASSIMNSCYTNRVWVGGFGLWEDADSNDGLAGYKYKSGGFIVGYDRLIGQSWIVGGSFAYNKGDFEDKAAIGHDSDIDNYSFNLYATYTHCSGFFGTAFAGYTYSDNDISETYLENLNNRVRSNHDNHTNTWVVGGKVGYDWKPNERFYITPSIGFTYINARTSAHQAMLGGNRMGRFSKLKDEAAYIPVELNIGYDVYVCEDSKLNLNLNLGYAYNFDEDGVSGDIALNGFGNGLPYSVQSREQGHHLFNVGAGATYSKGRFDFGVKYDYYRQEDADTHRVLGTVGFKF